MASTRIAVINRSTVLKNAAEIAKVVEALQTQVSRDFAAAWGIDAIVRFAADGKPQPGEWWLGIFDDSDQAGALGYHDITTEGLPLGKIFAKTDLTYHQQWSVTASHELLEMLADPDINLTAFIESSKGGGRLYAYEVCDPCEDDKFGYQVNGVLVSDFVYPSWFESFRKQGPFDHGKHIAKPFALIAGGYIGVYDVKSGSGWTQLTADGRPNFRARGPVGSRRERRSIPIDLRIPSEPRVLEEQAAKARAKA